MRRNEDAMTLHRAQQEDIDNFLSDVKQGPNPLESVCDEHDNRLGMTSNILRSYAVCWLSRIPGQWQSPVSGDAPVDP